MRQKDASSLSLAYAREAFGFENVMFLTFAGAAVSVARRASPSVFGPRAASSQRFIPWRCFALRTLGEVTSTPYSRQTRVSEWVRRIMAHRENSPFGRPFLDVAMSSCQRDDREGRMGAAVADAGLRSYCHCHCNASHVQGSHCSLAAQMRSTTTLDKAHERGDGTEMDAARE